MIPNTLNNHTKEILSLYLSSKINILAIFLKNNLNQIYDCNSKGDNAKIFDNREIDMDTLKKSISLLRDNSGERSLLSIGFYSERPVIEFRLIREIVNYCNEQLNDYEIDYVMYTNIGLLTDEVLEFLERENFKLLTDVGLYYTNSVWNLECKVIRNILKIKREYKGLFNNIKMASDSSVDINNLNSFLNNIKGMYSDKYKNHTIFYEEANKEPLNDHRNTYSTGNKGSMIDSYIYQLQGTMGNTEVVWIDIET